MAKIICHVLPFEKTAPGTLRRIRFSVSGSTGSRATNCDGAKLHSASDFFTTPPTGSVIIKHCCCCCRRLNKSRRSTGELCGQIVRDPDARSPCVRNKRFPNLLIAPLRRPFHFNSRALINIFMLILKMFTFLSIVSVCSKVHSHKLAVAVSCWWYSGYFIRFVGNFNFEFY